MKKLLILGGSHSDMPLIESGIAHGLTVFTTGNVSAHPGHRISHHYIPGDFSNETEMERIATELRIDAVVPGANDFALISAAYLAESLGLPGIDSLNIAKSLHYKDRFKELATSLGVPVGRYVLLSRNPTIEELDAIRNLNFPVLIKPVDLTGGKGIMRAHNFDSCSKLIDEALLLSKQSSVVIEEWFPGSLHSYSTVVIDREITFEYFDTEYCLYQDYLVSTSISLCDIPREAQAMVTEATKRVIKELNLSNGVLHCQFLYNTSNIQILEYTRRMSGDLYSSVIQLVRGIRHSDIFIAQSLNDDLRKLLTNHRPTLPYVSRHCITAEESGKFIGLLIPKHFRQFIERIVLAVPLGSKVAADGRSKVAVIILAFQSKQQMTSHLKLLKEDLKCIVMKD